LLLIDENRRAFPLLAPFPGELTVSFYSLRADSTRIPCASAIVSNATLQIAACEIPEMCAADNPLIAELQIVPEVGWEQEPRPTALVNCKGDCSFELQVVRPRKPTGKLSSANFDRGAALIAKKDVEPALFYLTEAAYGGLSFATAGANLLEKAGRQRESYKVLAAIDDASLEPASDRVAFQVLMRKANAARAADDVGGAVDAYANAQQIFPKNRQALSLAFTTIKQAAGSEDVQDIASYLERNQPVGIAFEKLCTNSMICPKNPKVASDYATQVKGIKAGVTSF
jgi:hypothetical protein